MTWYSLDDFWENIFLTFTFIDVLTQGSCFFETEVWVNRELTLWFLDLLSLSSSVMLMDLSLPVFSLSLFNF